MKLDFSLPVLLINYGKQTISSVETYTLAKTLGVLLNEALLVWLQF